MPGFHLFQAANMHNLCKTNIPAELAIDKITNIPDTGAFQLLMYASTCKAMPHATHNGIIVLTHKHAHPASTDCSSLLNSNHKCFIPCACDACAAPKCHPAQPPRLKPTHSGSSSFQQGAAIHRLQQQLPPSSGPGALTACAQAAAALQP